ncbi:helicase-related protein [Niallia sp. RD1]|uniref:helicase-related protein n=1 Tax=Niallia sp. RD1 TaxID=2962858 RepID=UPI0020C18FE7|nr:helicase-related protein [Niallia sp. RD1]UTI43146.1 RNA helicase [Niallia sp. RD1]
MINPILKTQYDKAVQQTKMHIIKDVNKYLENKESLPTFAQYMADRKVYIEQIWLNTWLNIATSHIKYAEKKQYLTNKGLDISDLSKKQINRLFRSEIRDVGAFSYEEWLTKKLGEDKENWKNKYRKQRVAYVEKVEEQKDMETKRKYTVKFSYYIEQLIEKHYEELFLYIRYLTGSNIALEIDRNGIILSSMELTFEEYLSNEMNMPYNQFYFLEDRTEAYENLILQHLIDFFPTWVKDRLPTRIKEEYTEVYSHSLTNSSLLEVSMPLLQEVTVEFLEDLLPEYVIDLEKLLDIPFDMEIHKEIMEKDRQRKAQKEAEDREEQRRRKEEEARMIEDIFGREYYPPTNIDVKYVLHTGETNTGKTFQAINRMMEASSGLYLAPLRLLALEIYEKLNQQGIPCSLKTGEEEKLVLNAQHQSSTVEMFHEKNYYEVIVIDEAQMIADRERGFSWYRAITKANANEVHIIASLHAKNMILQLLGDTNVEVHEYRRETPLQVENDLFQLSHTRKGDALVCFSRRNVLETASELQRRGWQVSVIYGSMPPEARKKQMERFIKGETKVIVSTDAIGMGLNLPIRRIVFLENDKFDGIRRRMLTSQEVKQIAGRAGRKGIYDIGRVAFTSDRKKMKYLLEKKDTDFFGFTIAPTSAVLERFQKYSNNLGLFFYLWGHFKSPEGTKKASLAEEMLLYEMIMDTMVEARMSLYDLFSFLKLPFATSESSLRVQWKTNMEAIVENRDLPEPKIKQDSLEELELAYKSIGLHLLFLYRLERRTEAYYWEKVRLELSDQINEQLKKGIKGKRRIKRCKVCGKELSAKSKFSVCNECFYKK